MPSLKSGFCGQTLLVIVRSPLFISCLKKKTFCHKIPAAMKKIVILNVIDDPKWDVMLHWHNSLKKAGIEPREVEVVDFYINPGLIDEVDLGSFEKIIITGSVSSPLESKDWIEKLKEVLAEILELGTPTLAVCFAHQFVARVIGGEVVKFEGRRCGNEGAMLTDEGRNSELFEGLPEKFRVLESFGYEVVSLPEEAEILAQSSNTDIYSFKYKNIHCTQFHPELGPCIVRQWFSNRRLAELLEGAPSMEDEVAYNAWLETHIQDAPLAQKIIDNFVAI